MNEALQLFFQPNQTIFRASAPGRLDVMGGIADYSGSLVLQMPIAERTVAWTALRTDGRIRVCSRSVESIGQKTEISLSIQDLVSDARSIDYDNVRSILSRIEGGNWAAYAIGCYLVLMKEKNISACGADILLDSQVPIGKGVSSSAAIEVAVMTALAEMFQLEMKPEELPILAQRVENRVVGAPCGIMDQLASYLGRENRLLPILCQPAQTYEPITIPEPIRFVGVDSGVRHAVSGASYGDVRTAAFMGYTIVARKDGVSPEQLRQAKESGNTHGLPFAGYLANIDLSQFESKYWNLLPERITGKEFLDQYGDTIDSITSIDPEKTYAVSVCAAHPVFENHRVNTFAHLLETLSKNNLPEEERRQIYRLLGEAMYESHSSYSACGLGCAGTDEIVKAVCNAGPQKGVYGAKITGGGSGGTVCVLCLGEQGVQTIKEITKRYAEIHHIEPYLFTGGSDGARWTGAKPISPK